MRPSIQRATRNLTIRTATTCGGSGEGGQGSRFRNRGSRGKVLLWTLNLKKGTDFLFRASPGRAAESLSRQERIDLADVRLPRKSAPMGRERDPVAAGDGTRE